MPGDSTRASCCRLQHARTEHDPSHAPSLLRCCWSTTSRWRGCACALLQDIAEPRVQVVGEAGTPSGAAGRSRAAPDARRWTLVLLDIRMPGRDGLQLAAALRALPAPAGGGVRHRARRACAARLRARRRGLPHQAGAPRAPAGGAAARGAARRWRRAPPPPRPRRRCWWSTTAAACCACHWPRCCTEGRAEVRDAAHGRAQLRARRRAVRLEQRLGPGLHPRPPQRAGGARRGARAGAPRASEPGPDDGGDEGWAVRVAPTDEWLAVSRRQLAAVREALAAMGRRGRVEPPMPRPACSRQPVLRSPAAMPLMLRWMPRCSARPAPPRPRRRRAGGSGAAAPPAGGSAGPGTGSGARCCAPAPGCRQALASPVICVSARSARSHSARMAAKMRRPSRLSSTSST
jgi:two-component system, LytTR family, response regulator AlgR